VIASNSRPAPAIEPAIIRRAAEGSEMVELTPPLDLLLGGGGTDERARAILIPLERGAGREKRVLLVGTSDLFAQQMLQVMQRVLLITLPVGIVAATLAAWLIAGLGVAPVREMHA